MARRPFRSQRGPKRQVTWIAPADQGFIAVATGAKVLIGSFDAAGSGLVKPTIVRTRGQVTPRVGATGASAVIIGAFGMAVVSDRAFAAGVVSVPGPFTDASWDGWFVWRSFSMSWDFDDATGIRFSTINMEVDSKAMRKVNDDETVVLVAESQSGAFDISMPLRMLVKLS